MNSTESIPQVWDDERDSQFFRITASLFRPAYCYGASVLLASYDPDDAYAAIADTSALAVPAQSASPAAHTAADIPSGTQPSAH